MKIKFRISVIFLCCLILQGCVGVSRVTRTVKTNNTACDMKNEYCWYPFDSQHSVNYSSPVKAPPTKNDVTKRFGKASEILNINNREIWSYRDNLAWRGFIPVLIIPIPLLIPVGFNHLEFGFEGDTVSSYAIERGEGGYCGLVFLILPVCN